MIVEVGLFRTNAQDLETFAAVADDIRAAFAREEIPGLHSFHMAPAVEDATRWAVLVSWESVAHHERFVASAEGQRQRVLLGEFMVGEPEVFHLSLDDVSEGLR